MKSRMWSAVDRVQKERSEDFRQDEQYRQLESVVDGVQDYYTASRNPMCDLTHDQKEELYAHITSYLRIEGAP